MLPRTITHSTAALTSQLTVRALSPSSSTTTPCAKEAASTASRVTSARLTRRSRPRSTSSSTFKEGLGGGVNHRRERATAVARKDPDQHHNARKAAITGSSVVIRPATVLASRPALPSPNRLRYFLEWSYDLPTGLQGGAPASWTCPGEDFSAFDGICDCNW